MPEIKEEEIEFERFVKGKRKPRGLGEMKEWLEKARSHVEREEQIESKIPDDTEAPVNEILSPELFSQLLEMGQETKEVLLGKEKMQDLGADQQKIVKEQLHLLRPLAEFITGVQVDQLQRELQGGMSADAIADRILESDEYADDRALAALGMLETVGEQSRGGEVPGVEPEAFAEEYRNNIKKKSFMKRLPKKLVKGFLSNVVASLIFAV